MRRIYIAAHPILEDVHVCMPFVEVLSCHWSSAGAFSGYYQLKVGLEVFNCCVFYGVVSVHTAKRVTMDIVDVLQGTSLQNMCWMGMQRILSDVSSCIASSGAQSMAGMLLACWPPLFVEGISMGGRRSSSCCSSLALDGILMEVKSAL